MCSRRARQTKVPHCVAQFTAPANGLMLTLTAHDIVAKVRAEQITSSCTFSLCT
jgi:hypothetical protein